MLGMPTVLPSDDPTKGFESVNHTEEKGLRDNPANSMMQPDISRLARREDLHNTIVMAKNMLGGQRASGGDGAHDKDTVGTSSWQTPKSAYNAQYPHNWVHETASGHAIELDDTPGAERVHIYHKSGTSIEIDSNGTMNLMTVGDKYITIDKNGFMKIQGQYNVDIGNDCNIKVGGNANLEVDGNYNINVHGDYNLNVAKQININAGNTIKSRGSEIVLESNQGGIWLDSKTYTHMLAGDSFVLQTHGDMHVTVVKSKFENILGNSNLMVGDSSFNNITNTFNLLTTDTILNSQSATNIGAGGNIVETGAQIHLNGPTAATATGATEAHSNRLKGKTAFKDRRLRFAPLNLTTFNLTL